MAQLDAELAHAGEETSLSPKMLLLEQMRITPDKQLKPMDFLFRLFGKPCFPRGELVAITGKAKSGKTFVVSLLMVCCMIRDILFFHRAYPISYVLTWRNYKKEWFGPSTSQPDAPYFVEFYNSDKTLFLKEITE